ncbi:MAG: DNA gyrase subunit A [Pseudomonadota bacterium]|jgi:DNA gyrase subunit A|nr:DNA gyrase subunit A [Alphaproteobacteria bacterium]
MSAQTTTDIKPVSLEEEMKRSYLDYAMSVIVSRALPDVRDGLKPVHRRILYTMKEIGLEYNKPHKKSANVVGNVMAKYHPHGNLAIYDAMVRMAQPFSLRAPLVDGQGNFGSMDGDPPAAERYTEARLSKVAHSLLDDIDQDTIDFRANYDDTALEPIVLPAKFPNLLVNGTSGIAVGMATNIPTHNLGEVIDATCALIDNSSLTLEEVMQYIPGPDFPTGASILGRKGIIDAFTTGRGSITIRAKTSVESISGNREAIIIHEIPYQVNKARMIEKIAELVRDKTIEGISDLRDESNREGVRVVIELKKDVNTEVILNKLYRHSQLQISFGYNMLALVHGRPLQLSLIEMLQHFIDFREDVIIRRTKYLLGKAREKSHLLLGFSVAVANLDPVIELIRASKDRNEAKEQLLARTWNSASVESYVKLVETDTSALSGDGQYRLSELQANAILDLRLHRLTGLEREKILKDLDDIAKDIQEYLDILGSRQRVLDILKEELNGIKEIFPSPRRTAIEEAVTKLELDDLIQREDMVITVSLGGYIKRVPLSTYRAQKRGGKGRSAMTTKDEDVVCDIIIANTHSHVLFFSTLGKVYQMKAYDLPLATPQSRGRAMINLLPLAANETISTVLVLPETTERTAQEVFLMFATNTGNVRRNKLEDFSNIPSNGKRAMKLDDAGEELIAVKLCTEKDDVMLFTKSGLCNRFNVVDNVRVFAGRDSNGVRGIKLQPKDYVISMTILNPGKVSIEERNAYLKMAKAARQGITDEPEVIEGEEEVAAITLTNERFEELQAQEEFILTVTENGFGKRSSAYEYRTTKRGGVGFDSIVTSVRNGGVIAAFPVKEKDQIMLVTTSGQLIRCPIVDVRITGRRTQGVIIFRIDNDEKVVSVSKVEEDEEEIPAQGD